VKGRVSCEGEERSLSDSERRDGYRELEERIYLLSLMNWKPRFTHSPGPAVGDTLAFMNKGNLIYLF
jgi:hypothetical protein